jgi:acetyl-CoA acyltransferase
MSNPRRACLVAGLRTPFARSGTVFRDVTAVQLARRVTQELLERTALDGLLPQLPRTSPAFSVNRACASAGQAITYAADQIVLGHADVVLAGGTESLSDIPILHSKRFSQILVDASKAKTLGQRLGTFARVRLRDFIPVSPAIAEPSTGESMGQSAEKMAKENGITREAQDKLAMLSHHRAAQATASGRFVEEIAPWFGGRGMDEVVTTDNLIRGDTSLDALAKLRPVFDKRYGSVTAGNASSLTDGAAVVLLMEEQKARALGYRPLVAVRSYAVAAVDPGWQLLMGPAFAVPKALDRAGIGWKELGLVEIHEAFASQVLSNAEAWASQRWAEKLGRPAPVGEVDWEKTNVHGGSIAIGHPFGATGARLATTLANEMVKRDVQFGLISICAQGGMGFAMVLERV